MNFIPLLIARIKSDQPEFYKKLQGIAIILLIIVGVVHTAISFGLFPISPDVLNRITTACLASEAFLGGIVGTSLTGTKDPDLISSDAKQAVIDSTAKTN